MFRTLLAALVVTLSGSAATLAGAADRPGCRPPIRHHHRMARHGRPQIVYGRAEPRPAPPVYNHEDNGAYDGADLPRPGERRLAYGQPPSWLDGYGTRPVVYGAYGTFNVYGGSAQVWPYGIGPAGGLGVYSPGAYGPGPSIVEVPDGY